MYILLLTICRTATVLHQTAGKNFSPSAAGFDCSPTFRKTSFCCGSWPLEGTVTWVSTKMLSSSLKSPLRMPFASSFSTCC
uniref:Secreted protein n=1 Tax=Zea mays TaxID=4577 RepID=C4J7K1_MAIZE|nr:unknown [Zea mays]